MVVWLFLGFSFFTDYMGPIINLPKWMTKVSPFGQTPQIPSESFEATPIIVMCCIFVVLLIIGFIGFRKRDILQS